MLRDELDLRRKTEIHEIEERKNGQINTLMKNHEKAFSDIKNYYNDVTLNNLALINTLKVRKSTLCGWDGNQGLVSGTQVTLGALGGPGADGGDEEEGGPSGEGDGRDIAPEQEADRAIATSPRRGGRAAEKAGTLREGQDLPGGEFRHSKSD